ncbi:putative ubiquitin carboxyl-terminal hydrolase 45 [Escherichia coli 2-156-04_S3_C2]|nr:putative ubiquitin carboxyl-terminal hydrolase 45 [Escherichia coli 2-156-04_S3_C2]
MGAAGGDAEVLECFFFFGDGELIVTEEVWLLLQCAKLWQSWLAAENFDD